MSGAAPEADHSPDPDERPAAGDGGIWHRIREHKIIQWALGYLAAALALTHAEELVARAFDWPEFISRALIVVLALGLPIAITLAWYHGHRASRHVTGAEASILAVLLLIGSGLLWALVRPHEPALTQSVAERAAAPTMSPVSPAAVPVTPASTAAPLVPAPNSGKPRIAILPFENLSPDPANAFFTDGLHEEIISTLSSRAPDLEVISRTTMMTYRTPKPVQEIARELGATHVLEGSVRREGNTVLLTLQLINARIDQHIWSQDYPRTLKSALTLQSEVANEVASQLAVQLAPSSSGFKSATRDPQAYDLYLKAHVSRQEISPVMSLADFERISALLEEAIQRDPKFGLAHVELANHYLHLYQGSGLVPCCDESYLRHAREQLDAAQSLIPGDAALTVTQAFYRYVTDAGTPLTQDVESALIGREQDSTNFAVASALFNQVGRFADTLALYQRLARLDPANFSLVSTTIGHLHALRRPEEALRLYDILASRPGWEVAAVGRQRTVFLCTGNEQALNHWSTVVGEMAGSDEHYRLREEFEALRFDHRYTDLRRLLAESTLTDVPRVAMSGTAPTAEFVGWTALLMRDLDAVRKQSEPVSEFSARMSSAWNGKLLRAEARLFAGDEAGAVAAARENLAARPRELDAGTWKGVASLNARVLAWAGAQDEAVRLLENLSMVEGGLYPGEITRDPLYTVPLAGNARYQALRAKLEAQMAATKLE